MKLSRFGNKLLRLCSYILFMTMLSLLPGCSDDSAPKDTEAPTVTFTNPSANETVSGTVSITVNVADNDEIAQVDLYVDSDLLGSDTASPYSFDWDTESLDDGSYTLKAVATDASGNTGEVSITVTVGNVQTLVTISVPDDQLSGGKYSRGFVFLSDYDGNVITSGEYTDGNALTLSTADYDEDTFILTEVLLYTGADEDPYALMYSYMDVAPGTSWTLYKDVTPTLQEQSTTLLFQSWTIDAEYWAGTDVEDYGEVTPTETELSLDIYMQNSPTDLYVLRKDDPMYGLYEDIESGTNVIVDLSEANQTLTEQSIEFPTGSTESWIKLRGTDGTDYSTAQLLGTFEDDVFYYPGTLFDHYLYYVYYEANGGTYYASGTDLSTPIQTFAYGMGTGNTTNGFTYSAGTSDNGDYLKFKMSTSVSNQQWYVMAPQGSGTIPYLALPDELSSLSSPSLAAPTDFSEITWGALDDASGYDDLLDLIGESTLGLNSIWQPGSTFIEVSEVY